MLANAVMSLFERRSEPTTLDKPVSWLWDWMAGGTPSASGVSITERNALSIATVWACVRAISEDLAKLPIDIADVTNDGTRTDVKNDPVWRLLNVQPNSEMSAMSMRETLTADCLLWGNGYAEIERRGDGAPIAIWPLMPDCVQVRRVGTGRSNRIVYDYTPPHGERSTTLEADDVLHIRGLGNGLVGYSVIRIAKDCLGLAKAAENFGSKFFNQGGRPSMILTHPKTIGPEAMKNLRASIEAQSSGIDNAHRPLILEENMTSTAATMPLEDAQFLQSRLFQVTDICRWFRFPPHMAGDLTKSAFSNIEQQGRDYATNTLGGWMGRWESEIAIKLFGVMKFTREARHDDDELTRGDMKTRYEAKGRAILDGWLSRSEVRRSERWNRMPDNLGDMFMVPVNMTSAEQLGKKTGSNAPNPAGPDGGSNARNLEGLRKMTSGLLTQAFTRSLKVEADRVRRLNPTEWDAFYAEHRDQIGSNLSPIVQAIIDVTGKEIPVGVVVGEIATRHVARSREALAKPGNTLDFTLGYWRGNRAVVDAEEEAARLVKTLE